MKRKLLVISLALLAILSMAMLVACNGSGDKTGSGSGAGSDVGGSSAFKDMIVKDGVLLKYCGAETNLTIPKGVTKIGEYAFYDCSSLVGVTIPDSITSIGYGAFSECRNLTSVTIGSGVSSIGYGAFSGCDGLQYQEYEGAKYLGNHLIKAISTDVTNVDIKQGTKSIAGGAFRGCNSLNSITIPDSVMSIGESAFAKCENLEKIEATGGNKYYKNSGNCLIEIKTKKLVKGFKSSEIPTDGSVTSIGENAFDGCSGLTSINIPDSVTSIGENAFYDCSSLTSITIPDSVTSIGYRAFSGCDGLQYQEYEGAKYLGNHLIKAISTDVTNVDIKQGTKSIAGGAFRGCNSLNSITIPDSVMSIGNSAFAECKNLEKIEATSGNKFYKSSGNCLIEIKTKKLISGCKNSVIPTDGSVTSIDDFAFSGRGLTNITIPNSVSSIGKSAFSGCSNLTNVNIPNSVSSIGKSALRRLPIVEN